MCSCKSLYQDPRSRTHCFLCNQPPTESGNEELHQLSKLLSAVFSLHTTWKQWFTYCCTPFNVCFWVKFHMDMFVHLQNMSRLLVLRFIFEKATVHKVGRPCGPLNWSIASSVHQKFLAKETQHCLEWGGAPFSHQDQSVQFMMRFIFHHHCVLGQFLATVCIYSAFNEKGPMRRPAECLPRLSVPEH